MNCKLPVLMKQQNITQQALAAATGLSPTTISKLARNHFDRIDNNTVTVLCRYFKLSRIDDLIGLEIEDGDMA